MLGLFWKSEISEIDCKTIFFHDLGRQSNTYLGQTKLLRIAAKPLPLDLYVN